MPPGLNIVEGGVYRVRSQEICEELGIELPNSTTNLVGMPLALVLGYVPGQEDFFVVKRITANDSIGQHIPISSTSREGSNGNRLKLIHPLPGETRRELYKNERRSRKHWYLKMDGSYKVPGVALEEVVNADGNKPMLDINGIGWIKRLQESIPGLGQPEG